MKSYFKFSFLIITISSILTINALRWVDSRLGSAQGSINQAVIAVGGEADGQNKDEDTDTAGAIEGGEDNQTTGNTTLKGGSEQENKNNTSTDQEECDEQDGQKSDKAKSGQSEEQKQLQQNLRADQIKKIKDAAAKFEGNVNSQIDQNFEGLIHNTQKLKLAGEGNQTEGNQTQEGQTDGNEGAQVGSEAQGIQDNQTQGNQTQEGQSGDKNEDEQVEDEQVAGSNKTTNVDQNQGDGEEEKTAAVGQGSQKSDEIQKEDESCDLDDSNYSKSFLKEKSSNKLKSHQSSSSSDDEDSCFD